MSQVNLVPTLRFSEFNAPWKLDKLGDYYTFKNGVNADKEQYGKGTKFINVLDVLQPYPITSDSIQGKVEVDEKTLKKNAVVNGNLLFQRSSETREDVGTSNVYLGDRTVTFGGFVIRGAPVQQVNPIYMNYLLKSSKARKEIVTKSGGSTRYNVGQETLSSVNIIVSDVDDEQRKIADFLTSVDTKIGQLTEKHRLLKEYKKGVMQQIFSQQIRFKDENGNEFPEWREARLSDVLKERKGKTTIENEHEVLTSSRNGLMKQSDYYGEGRITERSNIGFHIIPEGFLTYRSRSDDRLFFFNVNDTGSTGIISHYYPVFSMMNGQNDFFVELTRFHSNVFGKYAVGTSQVVLSFKALGEVKLPMPCTEEQQKIVLFLRSFDTKIQAIAKQIEQTKQFKKGLLQQMFV
ncbi:restriction endonuclease subunit S [Vibrio sp. 10N.239.311.G01]|uniref:restriction endonuclease subunit S n=1 Tax=Vibrio sp. 10N.239.311.G01 TaxID=3229976 RepID=UPI0035522629